MDEIYLDDGVYANQDGYHIWLWTSNGIKNSQKIALEPNILNALFNYRKDLLDCAHKKHLKIEE